MDSAPWRRAYTHALETNEDGDWHLADKLLIELAAGSPRSMPDLHELLTLALTRAGHDPENPEIVGDASDVWQDHIIAEACRRLQGTEGIYSVDASPPTIMYTVDPEARFLSVTEGWCDMMGYRPDEALGQCSLAMLTDESHRLANELHIPKLLEEGSIGGIDSEVVSKSGTVIPLVGSAMIERDKSGKHLRSIVSFQLH